MFLWARFSGLDIKQSKYTMVGNDSQNFKAHNWI
jgi:hypothetical protein